MKFAAEEIKQFQNRRNEEINTQNISSPDNTFYFANTTDPIYIYIL